MPSSGGSWGCWLGVRVRVGIGCYWLVLVGIGFREKIEGWELGGLGWGLGLGGLRFFI